MEEQIRFGKANSFHNRTRSQWELLSETTVRNAEDNFTFGPEIRNIENCRGVGIAV